MISTLAFILAGAVLAFFVLKPKSLPQAPPEGSTETAYEVEASEPSSPSNKSLTREEPPVDQAQAQVPPLGISMTVEGKTVNMPATTAAAHGQENLQLREFKTEDGVAVIDGDIVIGAPASGVQSGVAQIPTLQLWPSRVIPYFIQPSLQNPNRVHEALRMFAGTPIAFVPYADQEDVLVFQSASGTCKSYVGRIGGKQPLYISQGCGPSEIAHEIMHALGFTHEQNRFDRDRFLKVHRENIEPDKIVNFERMPENFMEISGLEDFSYSSIMLYAPDVFSRNGQPTMTPTIESATIAPSEELDRADINRLQRFYGSR